MSINVIQGRGEQHSMYYIPPRVSIIKNQYVIWERGPTMVSTIKNQCNNYNVSEWKKIAYQILYSCLQSSME